MDECEPLAPGVLSGPHGLHHAEAVARVVVLVVVGTDRWCSPRRVMPFNSTQGMSI